MKTLKDKKAKRTYQTPTLERIELDNEISLVLTSPTTPAPGPGEPGYVPENLNNDPFKTKIA